MEEKAARKERWENVSRSVWKSAWLKWKRFKCFFFRIQIVLRFHLPLNHHKQLKKNNNGNTTTTNNNKLIF